jgi:dinuclear metal center YbgI/SA1388 family protein
MAELQEIVEYLDEYLNVAGIPDYPGAHNGLQVENRSPIERVSGATDACMETIERAAAAGSQLLIVHHGLFWGEVWPAVGVTYRRLRALIDADMAVYSVHLPLDIHPEIGNNVLLAGALDLTVEGRFGTLSGIDDFGVWATADLPRAELAERVRRVCGSPPLVIEGGPAHVRRIGILTGGGGSMISQAHAAGLDTFLTGEGSHHTYHEATELGVNVLYAGHYATETLGVKTLTRRVAERFGIEWEFVDYPTGL